MKDIDVLRFPSFNNNMAQYQQCVQCNQWINTDKTSYAYIVNSETMKEGFIHLHGCLHVHSFDNKFEAIETIYRGK